MRRTTKQNEVEAAKRLVKDIHKKRKLYPGNENIEYEKIQRLLNETNSFDPVDNILYPQSKFQKGMIIMLNFQLII